MDVSTFRSLEDVKWAYSLQADPAMTITMMFVESVRSSLALLLTSCLDDTETAIVLNPSTNCANAVQAASRPPC